MHIDILRNLGSLKPKSPSGCAGGYASLRRCLLHHRSVQLTEYCLDRLDPFVLPCPALPCPCPCSTL